VLVILLLCSMCSTGWLFVHLRNLETVLADLTADSEGQRAEADKMIQKLQTELQSKLATQQTALTDIKGKMLTTDSSEWLLTQTKMGLLESQGSNHRKSLDDIQGTQLEVENAIRNAVSLAQQALSTVKTQAKTISELRAAVSEAQATAATAAARSVLREHDDQVSKADATNTLAIEHGITDNDAAAVAAAAGAVLGESDAATTGTTKAAGTGTRAAAGGKASQTQDPNDEHFDAQARNFDDDGDHGAAAKASQAGTTADAAALAAKVSAALTGAKESVERAEGGLTDEQVDSVKAAGAATANVAAAKAASNKALSDVEKQVSAELAGVTVEDAGDGTTTATTTSRFATGAAAAATTDATLGDQAESTKDTAAATDATSVSRARSAADADVAADTTQQGEGGEAGEAVTADAKTGTQASVERAAAGALSSNTGGSKLSGIRRGATSGSIKAGSEAAKQALASVASLLADTATSDKVAATHEQQGTTRSFTTSFGATKAGEEDDTGAGGGADAEADTDADAAADVDAGTDAGTAADVVSLKTDSKQALGRRAGINDNV